MICNKNKISIMTSLCNHNMYKGVFFMVYKELNFRTDMADERVDVYKKVHNLTQIDGVEVITKKDNGESITTVNILNENGEKALGKKVGTYVTIEIENINFFETKDKENLSKLIGNEIIKIL